MQIKAVTALRLHRMSHPVVQLGFVKDAIFADPQAARSDSVRDVVPLVGSGNHQRAEAAHLDEKAGLKYGGRTTKRKKRQ